MKIGYGQYQSPIGTIRVIADESGIKRIEIFDDQWEEYLKNNPEMNTSMENENNLIYLFQLKELTFEKRSGRHC
jgi:methylated-DNA-[protein]-cysteine S-methyltransferase